MTEAETRAELIDPALKDAGWGMAKKIPGFGAMKLKSELVKKA